MSLSRTAFATLLFAAFIVPAKPIVAAIFSSGTHVVDAAIDGIAATGPSTVVTVNAPAEVNPIPGTVPPMGVVIDNGAHVIVNGGVVRGRVLFSPPVEGVQAKLDIYGGTFEDSVYGGSGKVTIYGGTFQRPVIVGSASMDVYGGTFSDLGIDATLTTLNIYGRNFSFGDTLNDEINALFPGANFPIDQPGESFSMTTEKDPFDFFGTDVTGEALDGSLISFTTRLDGVGSINLIVVPEPSSVALVAFAMLSSMLPRRAGRHL